MSNLVVFDNGMKGIDTQFASMDNNGHLTVSQLTCNGSGNLEVHGDALFNSNVEVSSGFLLLSNTIASNTIIRGIQSVPSNITPINEIRLGIYDNPPRLDNSIRLFSECQSTEHDAADRWGYAFAIRNKLSLRSYVLNGGMVYSTLYNSSATSDDRMKFNETPITQALEIVRQLNPVTYDKSDVMNDSSNTIHRSGFIAQEVHTIPALAHAVVQGDENREWSLFYDDIFTHTVASIKELDAIVQAEQTQINEQNTKIQELETENTIMKNALNQLLSDAGFSRL